MGQSVTINNDSRQVKELRNQWARACSYKVAIVLPEGNPVSCQLEGKETPIRASSQLEILGHVTGCIKNYRCNTHRAMNSYRFSVQSKI